MSLSIHYALAIVVSALASFGSTVALADDLSISGSVFYRERIALPGSASLTVDLIDLSQATTTSVASTVVDPAGQVPIAFRLSIPADRLVSGKAYGLMAHIDVDKKAWFANAAPVPVDPAKFADPISILVTQVSDRTDSNSAVTTSLKDAEWHLKALGAKNANPEVTTTIIFNEDGSFSGSGGCNRIGGSAKFDGAALKLSDVLSTMMACDDAKSTQEREFLDALSKVASYAVDGDTLVLMDSAGVAIARMAVSP